MSGGSTTRPALPLWARLVVGAIVAVGVAFGLRVLYTLTFTFHQAVLGTTAPLREVDPFDPWAFGVTLGSLFALAGGGWLATTADRRRRRELQRWADAHGWSTDVPRAVLTGRWDTPPFARVGGRARDAMRRTDVRGTVTSFTYPSTGGRHVVMTTRPAYFGPAVWLTPEDRATRATEALGGQDIAVEWAAFNDRWRVESDDPRFAHAVLHQRMLERLMGPDAEGMSVLVENADVVVHAPGRTDFDRVEAMARLVLDVADLLPQFVVQDNPPLPQGLTRRAVLALRADRRRGRP